MVTMHNKPDPSSDPDAAIIDLTGEVNANWRDLLRKDPNHPAFRSTEPVVINMGRAVIPDSETVARLNAAAKQNMRE